jgi:ribonuclease P protein component
VFREGKRRRVGGLVVVTAPGPTGETRLGVVAGRRIGSAVLRNRVKRRVRHAMRQVEAPPATDVVVIGSRAALSAEFEDLVRWLARGCAQEDDHGS